VSAIERLIRRAGGPRSIASVFDVGAHEGADSLSPAERYPHIQFVAIEPTPDLAETLRRRSAHLPNYTVVEAAVASEEGSRTLNVYTENHGLNSLNELDRSIAPELGLSRSEPDRREVVVARRLSSICDELGIPTVDVIQIDTQGSDLDVLRSLDPGRLRALRAGAIEASNRLFMYDTSEDGREVRSVLAELGFRVYRIEYAHPTLDGEHDYYFVRSSRAPRVPFVDEAEYRSQLVVCRLRSRYERTCGRELERIRNALAIRTRVRAIADARRHP
jgi:FkbM family methyltransferase